MPNISVGIKGIYRSYGRVIEDFLCKDDGTYCIGNPGEGIMKRIFTRRPFEAGGACLSSASPSHRLRCGVGTRRFQIS